MNTNEDHTLEDHKLWKLTTEVWDALSAHFEPAVDHFTKTSDLDRGMLSLLLAVIACEPDAIMVADLMVRNPYTAAESFMARLIEAAENGYLMEVEQGSFRLSDMGRRELQELIRSMRAAMVKADPLPREDSDRLAKLLDRLVHLCLQTPPPPEPWSIRASYKLIPAIDPPMPYTEQAITCLSAYRDDAHLAAWQYTGITATAFEMLSLLWRNEANTLDKVYVHLAPRGHPREVYQLALEELSERKFVTGREGALSVTVDGRIFRNQVEEDTERFFFGPWKGLSYQEKTILSGLLIRLKEGLLSQVS